MAATQVGPDRLVVELSRLLGLPKNIISLDLHMAVDEIPTVTMAFYPELRTGVPASKTFEIKEKEIP